MNVCPWIKPCLICTTALFHDCISMKAKVRNNWKIILVQYETTLILFEDLSNFQIKMYSVIKCMLNFHQFSSKLKWFFDVHHRRRNIHAEIVGPLLVSRCFLVKTDYLWAAGRWAKLVLRCSRAHDCQSILIVLFNGSFCHVAGVKCCY